VGNTPEGKVKAKLRRVLAHYDAMYTYWPVPSGFGKTTLDLLGCYRGRFFSVETKAEGKKPTLRQTGELNNIGRAMGKTFVLAGVDDPGFEALTDWLDYLTETIDDRPYLTSDSVRRRAL
jgi:hypothetical protein